MFGRVIYSLLTGSSVCCLATAVAAQQAASTAPLAVEDRSTQEVPVVAGVSTGQATPDARGRQADDETTHDIVVTGSRVITNGNNSPTPITVITPETLQSTTPTNISDALRKLPVFAASGSVAAVTNPGSNSVGNFLNLRALGANRTLILFNGHRVPPTNSDATVDTNVLPQLLLARVDVATGGSSAVYGSDAVTGVVNFIVDRKFQGVRAVRRVACQAEAMQAPIVWALRPDRTSPRTAVTPRSASRCSTRRGSTTSSIARQVGKSTPRRERAPAPTHIT
jgi:outer membrane receptor protein involved in Fe transport